MRLGCLKKSYLLTVHFATLDGKNGISAGRHRCTGHDANRFTRCNSMCFVFARSGLDANDVQGEGVGCFGVKCAGKTIHGGIVKRWVVHFTGQVFGQNPARARFQRKVFDGCLYGRRIANSARFFNRNEVWSPIHVSAIQGLCLSVWVNGRMMEGGSMHGHG